ncbi:uncharacterized protein LOC116028918 [Ipomoea triloba]|uniref:uncharacterized protein LOC116028918 n=1 Tax=Ipomoea triloba TaxID=35885 RepID=UPI00125E141F|nr:uncharacterized protein LOC116028918 [Ipomoea triloba]
MSPTPLSIPPLPFFPKQHLIKSSNLHSQTLKEPSFHYLSSSPMKKLYRKGTVFPSPPLVSDQLAFLPAAIFTLTAALSQEDKQVLAYLLSCPSGNFSTTHKNSSPSGKGGGGADHPPSFNCFCFNCYRSYWARWDSSPNRQLIDEIIEAYEDGLQSKKEKSKRERRKSNKGSCSNKDELRKSEVVMGLNKDDSGEADEAAALPSHGGGEGEEEGSEKGSVRRLVSFLGEKIWSVWT